MKDAKISKDQLNEVLSYYSIGNLRTIKPLKAGSDLAPKKIILTDEGIYVLKCRSNDKNDLKSIELAHKVNLFLRQNNFPVAAIIEPAKANQTYILRDNHIFELFCFIEGNRYSGVIPELRDSARKLAHFHHLMANYEQDTLKPRNCFHDSLQVRSSLFQSSTAEHERPDLKLLCRDLLVYYNDSCFRVTQLGFDEWPKHIIHGDWHPGNMLFDKDKVAAVLDFDSIKMACPISDLANATLQYSIIAGRPNPIDWPEYTDVEKMAEFVKSYSSTNRLNQSQLEAIPDLMIETMIAEAIMPIAATGCFAHFSGIDFLKMILRKTEWISKNRSNLINQIM